MTFFMMFLSWYFVSLGSGSLALQGHLTAKEKQRLLLSLGEFPIPAADLAVCFLQRNDKEGDARYLEDCGKNAAQTS